jgi:putative peptide zinc metalloprotease protein
VWRTFSTSVGVGAASFIVARSVVIETFAGYKPNVRSGWKEGVDPPMRRKVMVGLLAASLTALLVVGVQALTDPGEPTDTAASSSNAAEPTSAPTQPGAAGDNIVVVVNQHDGKREAKSKDEIEFVGGDVVSNRNVAAAYSQCTGCRSVAVAVQVVLATGSASNVTPQNMALAINQECTACTTMAWAYQYVATTGGDVRLADGVNDAFHATGKQIAALIEQPLGFDELDSRIDALIDDMWSGISFELKRHGKPEGKTKKDADIDVEPAGTPTPEASTTAPEPTPTSSEEPTESPSPEPSPTASASAAIAGLGSLQLRRWKGRTR